MKKSNTVTTVDPHSPADRMGILPGDQLLTINGEEVIDSFSLSEALAEPSLLRFQLIRNGQIFETIWENDYSEPLGLELESLVLSHCGNRCVFCFIDQLPPNLRPTLYVKDEDYRFSFMYGNYITMSNLSQADLQRIVDLQFSPLYISVHATQPELRAQLLGRKHLPNVIEQLRFLAQNQISFHAQIVLCPELNDGIHLQQTFEDLHELTPHLLSIAIVPVGLTEYRQNLYPLRKLTSSEAQKALHQIHFWQQKNLEQWGSRIVFAADELYLTAQKPIPSHQHYEDYPQFENGVGMLRFAYQNYLNQYYYWRNRDLPNQKILLLSGVSAAPFWKEKLQKHCPSFFEFEVQAVENSLFGSSVTVTGLLTAADIERAIEQHADESFDHIAISAAVFNHEDVTLDDVSRKTLCQKYPRLRIIHETFHHFVQTLIQS